VVVPSETIKVRLMHDQTLPANQRRYHGFVSAVKQIIRDEGLGGIYQGVSATVIKQASNQAVRFLSYNEIRDLFKRGDPKRKITPLETAAAGAIAGVIGVLANNPVDTVKTRMQGLDAKRYQNTWDCFVKILRQEGFLAFYKGVGPRMTRIIFGQAIIFTTYEHINSSLQRSLPF
jgi:solute carrier family 25 citrate transporter 1